MSHSCERFKFNHSSTQYTQVPSADPMTHLKKLEFLRDSFLSLALLGGGPVLLDLLRRSPGYSPRYKTPSAHTHGNKIISQKLNPRKKV